MGLLAALLVGCTTARGTRDDTAIAYPDGCAFHHLTMRQCDAFIGRVAREHGLDLAKAAKVVLLGDPGCGENADPHILCTRSTSFGARVQIVMPDGSITEESKFCGVGGQQDLECTDPPQLMAYHATGWGYFDVPEGASPPPTFNPAALSRAVPLSVPSLDIPIDHLGAYHLQVGRALLANGLLRHSTLALTEPSPTTFLLADSAVAMRVEHRDGTPLRGPYAGGWQPETVEVAVFVDFTVTQFDPGAVLRLRDLTLE